MPAQLLAQGTVHAMGIANTWWASIEPMTSYDSRIRCGGREITPGLNEWMRCSTINYSEGQGHGIVARMTISSSCPATATCHLSTPTLVVLPRQCQLGLRPPYAGKLLGCDDSSESLNIKVSITFVHDAVRFHVPEMLIQLKDEW